MMPLPYCVYILFNHKDYILYTGYTTSIEEQIKSHNAWEDQSTFLPFCFLDTAHATIPGTEQPLLPS